MAFRAGEGCPRHSHLQSSIFLHYGVFLKEKGLVVKSIKGRFSVLAFAGEAMDRLWDRVRWCDFRVRKVLDSRAREVASVFCYFEKVKRVVAEFVLFQYEALLFHASVLVDFLGVLRVSELVVMSQKYTCR